MTTAIWVRDAFRFFDKNNDAQLDSKELSEGLHIDGNVDGVKDGKVSEQELSKHFNTLRDAADIYESCPSKPSKPAVVEVVAQAKSTIDAAKVAELKSEQAHDAYRAAIRENTHFKPTSGAKAAMIAGGAVGVGGAIAAAVLGLATPIGFVLGLAALVAALVAAAAAALSNQTDWDKVPKNLEPAAHAAERAAEVARDKANDAWDELARTNAPAANKLCR